MTDQTLFKHQVHLEQLFSKNQLIPRIKKEFSQCASFDFEAYMIEKNIPVPFGMDLLTQMALHKRCSLGTLVGILRHHFDDGQLTADMCLKAAMADLVDWLPRAQQFVVRFTISDDVQEELDKYQFPLPMIIPPIPVLNNRSTGYVMNNSSIILKKNHHEDDVCLDHINRVNNIKFTVNLDTATMVKNQWRNLDKPKQGEKKEDFEKRKRQFNKYDKTAHKVIAELTVHGNEFYLTHRYDKRGRVYAQGYHINYQGTSWNKAIIELADKELVSDT